jgi:hypothetical protein
VLVGALIGESGLACARDFPSAYNSLTSRSLLEIASLDMSTSKAGFDFGGLLLSLFIRVEPHLFDIQKVLGSSSGELHLYEPRDRNGAYGKAIPIKPLTLPPCNRLDALRDEQIQDSKIGPFRFDDSIHIGIGERDAPRFVNKPNGRRNLASPVQRVRWYQEIDILGESRITMNGHSHPATQGVLDFLLIEKLD